MDLVSKTVDETSAKIQTQNDTPDKSLGNKQKSNSINSSYNPKLPHLNNSQDKSETQDKSGLIQDSPAHAQEQDDGLVDTDTETDDDDVNNNTKKRKSGVLTTYQKKKRNMLKSVLEMQKIQQDFIDLKDMNYLEYVRPISRDKTNPFPSCLVEDGILPRKSVYVGHKSDGTNIELMTRFIDRVVIGIERDETTKKVNETYKTTKVFDPAFVSKVKKYRNVRHRISTKIQGNIIKMGMNYGKVSENLIHSLAKSKDGSINARVQKYDGSFIYFPIEPRFLDKHFNMYVAYIQCIRNSSDGKFRQIPKGCCRESKRNKIMDYGLDTKITPHRHLKLLQKDNENTCVILNILNAVIIMGDTETYNKMEHLQICSVWIDFLREQTDIHKYKDLEISVVMSILRKCGTIWKKFG
jgi:hypothetical protein